MRAEKKERRAVEQGALEGERGYRVHDNKREKELWKRRGEG